MTTGKLNWGRPIVAMAAMVFSLGVQQAAAQETTTLAIAPGKDGDSPMEFEAQRSNVIALGNGYIVNGSVDLKTPLGKIGLAGASLFFGFAPGTQTIDTVRGTAFVPSPYNSPDVIIKKPAMAEFGVDLGKNLDLGVPLNDDRRYAYFRFDSGFEMQIGATGDAADAKPLTLAIPAGASATLVIDPLDPFYYFSGGLLTPEKDESTTTDPAATDPTTTNPTTTSGDTQQTGDTQPAKDQGSAGTDGYGTSSQSLIPFRPATTYGIADKVSEFQGNRIEVGTFPMGGLPVEITGTMISDINQLGKSEKAVDPLQIGIGPWAQIGVNGEFNFGFPFLKVKKLGNLAEFGFKLGQATAALQVVDGTQQMYFSGVIAPDTSWLPDIVPIRPDAELKAYGYVSSAGADFRLHTEGKFKIDASRFGQIANVDLGDIFYVDGAMNIDHSGFLLSGLSDTSLGVVGYEEQRHVEIWIPFDGTQTGYLQLDGLNRVSSLSVRGVLRASAAGLQISGKLDSKDLDVEVAATVAKDESGATKLSGRMSVPPQFQSAVDSEITAEAQKAKDAVGSIYDGYRAATENYQFELSLRGMKTVIPPACDQATALMGSIERTVYKELDKRWPWYAPGKSSAKSQVHSQMNAYRARISTLKNRVQYGDTETVRAALRSALVDLLNHQVVTVKVKIVTYTYTYTHTAFSSAVAADLRKAIAAVDALPAASSRKISAEQAWNAAPKREQLISAADAIANSGSPIRIQSIGFSQPVFQSGMKLFVDVSVNGAVQTITVDFDPANPVESGYAIGRAIAVTL